MTANPTEARTKFITPTQLVEGTIVEVHVNQDPFHCIIKILPRDPTLISAEGRYSDHEISLGKLKRNLVHLKFAIRDMEDIISAVESLEGRECIFRVDKSGWISWIPRLIPQAPAAPTIVPATVESVPIPAPIVFVADEVMEVFFIREPGHRSVYRMENQHGGVLGWAVGPSGVGPKPHGWVLDVGSVDEAVQILKKRKQKSP